MSSARTICEKTCLESVLFDVAHGLGFYLASAVVRISEKLQIHFLWVVRSCKHEEIITVIITGLTI